VSQYEVDGIRCMQMRGGSSKGAYFLAEDLPAGAGERDDLLLRVLGSPDPRQIDGLGGGHPLTSKVAVVRPSADGRADVDYLFLQIVPDRAIVTDTRSGRCRSAGGAGAARRPSVHSGGAPAGGGSGDGSGADGLVFPRIEAST